MNPYHRKIIINKTLFYNWFLQHYFSLSKFRIFLCVCLIYWCCLSSILIKPLLTIKVKPPKIARLKLDLTVEKSRLPQKVAQVGRIRAPQKFRQMAMGSDRPSRESKLCSVNSVGFSAGLPSMWPNKGKRKLFLNHSFNSWSSQRISLDRIRTTGMEGRPTRSTTGSDCSITVLPLSFPRTCITVKAP